MRKRTHYEDGKDHIYRGSRPNNRDLTRTIQCSFCELRFKQVKDVRRHEETVHYEALLVRKTYLGGEHVPNNPFDVLATFPDQKVQLPVTGGEEGGGDSRKDAQPSHHDVVVGT